MVININIYGIVMYFGKIFNANNRNCLFLLSLLLCVYLVQSIKLKEIICLYLHLSELEHCAAAKM